MLVLKALAYVGAWMLMIWAWDETWPKFQGTSPDELLWWVRTVMIAALVTTVQVQWKKHRKDNS